MSPRQPERSHISIWPPTFRSSAIASWSAESGEEANIGQPLLKGGHSDSVGNGGRPPLRHRPAGDTRARASEWRRGFLSPKSTPPALRPCSETRRIAALGARSLNRPAASEWRAIQSALAAPASPPLHEACGPGWRWSPGFDTRRKVDVERRARPGSGTPTARRIRTRTAWARPTSQLTPSFAFQ